MRGGGWGDKSRGCGERTRIEGRVRGSRASGSRLKQASTPVYWPLPPTPGSTGRGLCPVDSWRWSRATLEAGVGPRWCWGCRKASASVRGKARLKAGGMNMVAAVTQPVTATPAFRSPVAVSPHPPQPCTLSYSDDQRPSLCRKQKPKLFAGFFLCRLPHPLLLLPTPAPGWKPSPT